MKKTTIVALAFIAIIAASSLSLAVGTVAASPLDNMNSLVSNRPLLQKSWIRINGIMTNWGDDEVNGLLQVRARTTIHDETANIAQLASATATWTENDSRPISSIREKENFTYVFYSARLRNATTSELNYEDNDYYLNGTWNLYTVTSNITVYTDENDVIVKVHRESDTQISKANGNLNVTDNWTKFTLSIEGQPDLTGKVFRSMTRLLEFSPFKITEETTNKVTKADLSEVVKCYRAMPGWGNYNAQMDFNGNFKVDIADLATIAANM